VEVIPVRSFFVAASAAAVLLTAVQPARSQAVPDLNVDPVCRGIAQQAANPSEKGGPDLAFSQCVQSEQTMRQKLVDEWSTFSPSEKSNCIGAQGGDWRAIPTSSVASKWQKTRGSSVKASKSAGGI
jgi:hypothetical protein